MISESFGKLLDRARKLFLIEKKKRKRARSRAAINSVKKGEQNGLVIKPGEKPNFGRLFYVNERTAQEYLFAFVGLRATLSYAAKLKNKKVVDVGSGTTKAINEIKSIIDDDTLDFVATNITPNPGISENLGKEKTAITSVEEMRGFSPSSVSCILGHKSIMYSKDPEAASRRMDTILEPGGVIKLVFSKKGFRFLVTGLSGDPTVSSYKEFVKAFEELGYKSTNGENICITKNLNPGPLGGTIILTLVKPQKDDSKNPVTALELVRQDFKSLEESRYGLYRVDSRDDKVNFIFDEAE